MDDVGAGAGGAPEPAGAAPDAAPDAARDARVREKARAVCAIFERVAKDYEAEKPEVAAGIRHVLHCTGATTSTSSLSPQQKNQWRQDLDEMRDAALRAAGKVPFGEDGTTLTTARTADPLHFATGKTLRSLHAWSDTWGRNFNLLDLHGEVISENFLKGYRNLTAAQQDRVSCSPCLPLLPSRVVSVELRGSRIATVRVPRD